MKEIQVQQENVQDGSFKVIRQINLNTGNELKLILKQAEGIRYLWTITK
jgi:hypothetical protein